MADVRSTLTSGPLRLLRGMVLVALFAAAPALAAGPDRAGPDQPPARPGAPQVSPDDLVCDDDPERLDACGQAACVGDHWVLNEDHTLCVPCTDETTANAFNTRCVCREGYETVGFDPYGRELCEVAETAPPQTGPQTIEVVADIHEFYGLSQIFGFESAVTEAPLGSNCSIIDTGDRLLLDFVVLFAGDWRCRISLFGGQLDGGWTFVGFEEIDTSECMDAIGNVRARITKRSSDPADMTHDVALAVAGGEVCTVAISGVRLSGPDTLAWQHAFQN